jgi:hypothetical protein
LKTARSGETELTSLDGAEQGPHESEQEHPDFPSEALSPLLSASSAGSQVKPQPTPLVIGVELSPALAAQYEATGGEIVTIIARTVPSTSRAIALYIARGEATS